MILPPKTMRCANGGGPFWLQSPPLVAALAELV
jgi:hypothetical protein